MSALHRVMEAGLAAGFPAARLRRLRTAYRAGWNKAVLESGVGRMLVFGGSSADRAAARAGWQDAVAWLHSGHSVKPLRTGFTPG